MQHIDHNIVNKIKSRRNIGMCSVYLIDGIQKDQMSETFLKLGFKDVPKLKINEEVAIEFIVNALHTDMAYASEIIPVAEAQELAQEFLKQFAKEKTEYYTNAEKNSWGGFNYIPTTESTFDTGVVMCDGDKFGVIWVEDED